MSAHGGQSRHARSSLIRASFPINERRNEHSHGASFRRIKHRQYLRRRHRQAVEALAERVVDGVGDGGHHRHQRHFADTLHALRMLRVRHLDHHGVDHRQVRTNRHAIVEEAGIIDLAVFGVDVFLVQRPADPLRDAALHLALDITRMDGAADVLHRGVADDAHDPELGIVRVIRYTAVQDVGRAIHPGYVEGQMQGGVAQGIGWALNEEYIYNKDGKVDNPGFLDYRMPVCSDLPMLDTVMVEVPNPKHPQGVKGVGEVPLVPVMAAGANAVHNALGKRFYSLPMSPPKVLEVIDGPERLAAAE